MLQELDVLIGFVVVISIASLLNMVITQAISSCLALRGQNLRDALVALFLKISPDLTNAKALAEKILKDPVYSDSSLSMKGRWPEIWKLTSAIRPGECLQVIQLLESSATDGELQQVAKELGALQADAKKLVTQMAASPELKAIAAKIASIKAAKPVTGDLTQLAQYESVLMDTVQSSIQLEFQTWERQFNAAQDRASQWFAMNTRWLTVGLGFVAAFLLQLDTFELFNRISTDEALRNGLVNLSTAVEKRADEAMNAFSRDSLFRCTEANARRRRGRQNLCRSAGN
jgi:hypothetical protein